MFPLHAQNWKIGSDFFFLHIYIHVCIYILVYIYNTHTQFPMEKCGQHAVRMHLKVPF